MRSVTGVELGPGTCVLARVRGSGGRVEISAVHGLGEGDWDSRRTFAQNLREARREGRFPRTARVVAWGLHEPAMESDASTESRVAPLREAGFAVDTVLSPARTLALLARRRPRAGRDTAVWLALNRHAAAIAIVANGDLLYAREFDWHYRPAASVKEELLRRYSLVAHLAPEVQHGLDIVRAQRRLTVDAVVTCGDLPDLRSLTMPLIEELEIEVETLDTLEGLDMTHLPDAMASANRVPALCLAAAVAAGEPSASARVPVRSWLTAAAAVAVLTAGTWVITRRADDRPAEAGAGAPGPALRPPAVPSGTAASASPARAPAGEAPAPAATTGQVVPPQTVDAGEGRASGRPEIRPKRTEATGSRAPRVAAQPSRAIESPAPPLEDPLPVVNSILVAPDRRLAVVAGEIVHEGDAIGRRILIRIEPHALVLREPSGREVRVPIRRKVT